MGPSDKVVSACLEAGDVFGYGPGVYLCGRLRRVRGNEGLGIRTFCGLIKHSEVYAGFREGEGVDDGVR